MREQPDRNMPWQSGDAPLRSRELSNLAASVGKRAPARKPAGRTAPQARKRIYKFIKPVIVIALLACFVYLFRDVLLPPSRQANAEQETSDAQTQPEATSGAAAGAAASVNPLPAGFKPLEQAGLKLAANGAPLVLDCRLRAPLDRFTQRMWIRSGLLAPDATNRDLFLSSVTVKSQEALGQLLDWHVEAVALKGSSNESRVRP